MIKVKVFPEVAIVAELVPQLTSLSDNVDDVLDLKEGEDVEEDSVGKITEDEGVVRGGHCPLLIGSQNALVM